MWKKGCSNVEEGGVNCVGHSFGFNGGAGRNTDLSAHHPPDLSLVIHHPPHIIPTNSVFSKLMTPKPSRIPDEETDDLDTTRYRARACASVCVCACVRVDVCEGERQNHHLFAFVLFGAVQRLGVFYTCFACPDPTGTL